MMQLSKNKILFKPKINKLIESKPFELIMTIVIILSILLFIIQSDKIINAKFFNIFKFLDNIFIVIFSAEYFFRAISLKKIKDLFKPLLLLDLIVILPFYLNFLSANFFILRLFRLSRVFRIFKIARYNNALHNIYNAVMSKKEELIMAMTLLLMSILISASLMCAVEGHAQQSFSTIPRAMWWSVITFTSVGYGDVYPITAIGKIIASIVAVLGVAIHGLLASILISGFLDEKSKVQK